MLVHINTLIKKSLMNDLLKLRKLVEFVSCCVSFSKIPLYVHCKLRNKQTLRIALIIHTHYYLFDATKLINYNSYA